MEKLILDGQALTLDEIEAVSIHGRTIEIAADAQRRIAGSRKRIEGTLEAGETGYGVNTDCGKLADVNVRGDKLAELQINLLGSHAGEVGKRLSDAEARAKQPLSTNVQQK